MDVLTAIIAAILLADSCKSARCHYEGRWYRKGEARLTTNACNRCVCSAYNRWVCTRMRCKGNELPTEWPRQEHIINKRKGKLGKGLLPKRPGYFRQNGVTEKVFWSMSWKERIAYILRGLKKHPTRLTGSLGLLGGATALAFAAGSGDLKNADTGELIAKYNTEKYNKIMSALHQDISAAEMESRGTPTYVTVLAAVAVLVVVAVVAVVALRWRSGERHPLSPNSEREQKCNRSDTSVIGDQNEIRPNRNENRHD